MAKKRQRGFKMFYPGGPLVIPESAKPSYMAPATNLSQAPTPNISQPTPGAQAPAIGLSNIGGAMQGVAGLYGTISENLSVPKIQEKDFTSSSKQELLSKATDFKGYEMPKTNAVSSGLGGAASGAAAGTAIAPGIGTAIGAVVGGVGGAVSSIFGNSKRKRAKRRAERAAINNINAQNTELTEDSIYSSLSSQLAEGGPMKRTKINQQQDIEALPLKMASWIQGRKPFLKMKVSDILKSKSKTSFIGLDAIGNVLDLAADEYEINKSANPKREREIRENMRKESLGLRDYGLPYTVDPMSNGGSLVEFKNGGSHEENPLGGIPQGYNENGDLNLVEQGETKWNDYIFSNRNKLSKAERFGLPGTLNNRTFSSAAKTIQKESKERPFDSISKRGLNKQMDYLISAQEEHNAMLENTNQFKSGGKMNSKSRYQGIQINGNPKTVKHGYGDWLRYAPVASNVIGLATDIASTPEAIQTARIEAPLLTENMSYDPVDQEYLTNKLTSNYANLVDKIQGSSGGNRGVANASMIAAMNNLYDAYGDTAIKSREYNRDMLSKTLEFNRATSQANAQMRMAADQYNANAEDRMIATNAANRAARRNAIREQIAALGENIGAIGTEQRWMDLAPKLFRGYKSNGDYINQTIRNIVLDKSDSPSPLEVAKSRGLIKDPSQKIDQRFIDLVTGLQSKSKTKKGKEKNTVVKADGGYLSNGQNRYDGGGWLGTGINEDVATAASFLPVIGTMMDGAEFIEDPSWEKAGWFLGGLASDIFTGGAGRTALKGVKLARRTAKAAEALKAKRLEAALKRGNQSYSTSMKAYRKAKALESQANKDVLNGVGKIAGIQGADILLNSTQQNTKAFGGSILKGGGGLYDDPNEKKRGKLTAQTDNTYVEKPRVEEPVEQSVNGVKWSDLDFRTQMRNRGNLVNGYPTEKGLEIVSPEFDIISGIRGITNLLPKTQTFYHGSPVRFNKFNTQFIGSGEGGSKAMKGINLWPDNHFGAAPKFANIRSSDAPLHLGRASKEISGELNPTIYKVRGRNLNIYSSNTSKGLDQQELVNLGYDGFSNGKQYTIFPESVNKLKIKKHYSIPEFVKTHKKIDSWAPWSTDINKMNNILELAGSSKRF